LRVGDETIEGELEKGQGRKRMADNVEGRGKGEEGRRKKEEGSG
jgi:hypothetical protein